MLNDKYDPTNPDPHGMGEPILERLAQTSGEMYDAFYDMLAEYQFDFSLSEKKWMLSRICYDIAEANRQAEQDAIDQI